METSSAGVNKDVASSILVVDDYVDLAEPLVRLLRRMGYAAEAVLSGGSAIEYLQTHRPSLVILDLMMPDISGLQVLEWARKSTDLKALPIIIYTTANEENLLKQCIAAGANEVWLKGSLDFFQIL